jgi:prepilin-type N-terminal cleavage/methylation domain-containing protein
MREPEEQGFTIVELLMATTVFSLVLLGALAGFLQIGKLFYKGVSATSTQEAANQILQDVSGQFQSSASFTKVLPVGLAANAEVLPTTDQSTSYAYYCIGNTRYTYVIARDGTHMVNFDSTSNHRPGGNFGVLKDTLPGSSGCATPCNDDPSVTPTCPNGAVRFRSPVELLGDNMRLNAFYINSSATNSSLFNIRIIVAYGLDDAFTQNPPQTTIPPVCDSNSGIDQFCSVTDLNTAVFRGWNQ